MYRKIIAIALVAMCTLTTMADLQGPADRQVLGFSGLSGTANPKFVEIVNAELYKLLATNPRFHILDVTSPEKAQAALEATRDERYMDETDINVEKIKYAADNLIVGEIIKLPIVKESVNGKAPTYKAAVEFTVKITNPEKGETSDAMSIKTPPALNCASASEAVAKAAGLAAEFVNMYLSQQFPINAKMAEILESSNKGAKTVLLDLCAQHGVKVGDLFKVTYDEELDGDIIPETVCNLKVTALRGKSQVEASVEPKGAATITSRFSANQPMDIIHQTKKK